MEHNGLSKDEAYDQARREFYKLRTQEDIERHVAKEEAWSTGAYFGKGALEVGVELEDQAFERWRDWINKTATEITRAREVMNSGSALPPPPEEGEQDADESNETTDAQEEILESK